MTECNECGRRISKASRHNDPRDERFTEEWLCVDCCRGALEEMLDEIQSRLDALPPARKRA